VRWRDLGEWLRLNPGIHMVRRARCSCPVAEFIRDRCPYGSVPQVHHDRWWVSEWEGNRQRVRNHRTSPKVRDFILAVDERKGDITGAEALEVWEAIDRRYG
jgi:hypothetical protein